MKNDFLESLFEKEVVVTQKDGFIKSGVFVGYDEHFIFLEFNDRSKVAISRDSIISIKVQEDKDGE